MSVLNTGCPQQAMRHAIVHCVMLRFCATCLGGGGKSLDVVVTREIAHHFHFGGSDEVDQPLDLSLEDLV